MERDEDLTRKLQIEREGLLWLRVQYQNALKFQIGVLDLAKAAIADLEERLSVLENILGIAPKPE